MKNQVNIKTSNETNKATITTPQEMKIYQLSNKELKAILLKKFSELWKNIES